MQAESERQADTEDCEHTHTASRKLDSGFPFLLTVRPEGHGRHPVSTPSFDTPRLSERS